MRLGAAKVRVSAGWVSSIPQLSVADGPTDSNISGVEKEDATGRNSFRDCPRPDAKDLHRKIVPVLFPFSLLQAATSRKGPASACLTFVDAGRVILFVSTVTLDEIRDVLNRPEIRRSFRQLTDEKVQDSLDHLVIAYLTAIRYGDNL